MAPHVPAKTHTRNRLRLTIHQNDRSGLVLAVKLPRLPTRPRQRAWKISFRTQCPIQTTKICGKSSKVWMLLLMLTLQMKQYPTTVSLSLTSNPYHHYDIHTMPGVVNLPCYESIEISTNISRNVSKHHLLTMKAVLHFNWVNYYLPSRTWSTKGQLALTTFHLYFSSHLVVLPSRKYYRYSTHPFHLPTVHLYRGLPQSFQYWNLGNILVKLNPSAPLVSHLVMPNFWNTFLLIIFTTSPKPKIYSADFKPVFIKVGDARLRLLGLYKL